MPSNTVCQTGASEALSKVMKLMIAKPLEYSEEASIACWSTYEGSRLFFAGGLVAFLTMLLVSVWDDCHRRRLRCAIRGCGAKAAAQLQQHRVRIQAVFMLSVFDSSSSCRAAASNKERNAPASSSLTEEFSLSIGIR